MSDDLHIPILNVFLDDEHEVMPPGCLNHEDRARVTNLDGDDLCQECADAWVRAEGSWQASAPSTCIETIGGDPDTALRLSFQIKVF